MDSHSGELKGIHGARNTFKEAHRQLKAEGRRKNMHVIGNLMLVLEADAGRTLHVRELRRHIAFGHPFDRLRLYGH